MSGPVTSRLAGVTARRATVGDRVTLTAGEQVAAAVTRQLAADGAPLSRYRGGGGPPRVEARRAGADTAEVVPTSGAGQIGILQSGARPHRIGHARVVLAFQGGEYVTGAVNHPGSPARRSFTRGTESGRPAAVDAARRVFDGVTGG